jgi:hypothetical protein
VSIDLQSYFCLVQLLLSSVLKKKYVSNLVDNFF